MVRRGPYQRKPTAAGRANGWPALSDRERDVIRLRCQGGYTNADTGIALGISEQTVKNHVTMILRKTGCRAMDCVCFEAGTRHQAPAIRAERPEQV